MGGVCTSHKFEIQISVTLPPNGSANFNQLSARKIILSVYLNKPPIRGIVNFSKDSICLSHSCCNFIVTIFS